MVVYFDTTLRDGCQQRDIHITNQQRLQIVEELQQVNMDYIEVGWPGVNSNIDRFIEKLNKAQLGHLVLFGSTRRVNTDAAHDIGLQHLIQYEHLNTVCIYGKTWDLHVKDVLGVSLEEGLDVIYDSIKYLKDKGKTVFFDAEHYFDGFKHNQDYALRCYETAVLAGAESYVMCDTNGGSLPNEVVDIVSKTIQHYDIPTSIGLHMHDDTGCAVANSIAPIDEDNDNFMIQGTINGYGERCGNANLCTVIPNLVLKKHIPTDVRIDRLTTLSNNISSIMGQDNHRLPYVGACAFSHKAGTHVNSVMKNPSTYEHIDPTIIGNERKVILSESSGTSNIVHRGLLLGYTREQILPHVTSILHFVKEFENFGASIEDYPDIIEQCYSSHIGE